MRAVASSREMVQCPPAMGKPCLRGRDVQAEIGIGLADVAHCDAVTATLRVGIWISPGRRRLMSRMAYHAECEGLRAAPQAHT